MEDVVILGSGCAGLTAAIYTARASLRPLVLDGTSPGGQIMVSSEVENYPGFPDGISGAELVQSFKDQAARFGTRFQSAEAISIEKNESHFEIKLSDSVIEARTVIIATGAVARRLGVPNEDRFYGKGVSGCATCDGFFFRDKEVVVVGGGNTAVDDALFLSRFASKITIVHRREYLRAEPVQVERANADPKIEWKIPYIVQEVLGEDSVTGLRLQNRETGQIEDLDCNGVFVAIGHDPATKAVENLVKLDDDGFIITDGKSSRTATEGLYACGDVCDPVYKQAVVAGGNGCVAAIDAQHYLEDH